MGTVALQRTLTGVCFDNASDGDLWARACGGDGDAVVAVYGRYADRVHGYCFRRTGSWALAQDLTSTGWLEAWRRRGDIDLGRNGSLAPWLFGIAHSVVRNSDRAQRRHRAALARLPDALAEPDHAERVAARMDDERRMRQVLNAVNRLPRHEQDVLALVIWAGLSHAETAAALGISPGTVKSRLSRARVRLRAADGDDSADPSTAASARPTTTTLGIER